MDTTPNFRHNHHIIKVGQARGPQGGRQQRRQRRSRQLGICHQQADGQRPNRVPSASSPVPNLPAPGAPAEVRVGDGVRHRLLPRAKVCGRAPAGAAAWPLTSAAKRSPACSGSWRPAQICTGAHRCPQPRADPCRRPRLLRACWRSEALRGAQRRLGALSTCNGPPKAPQTPLNPPAPDPPNPAGSCTGTSSRRTS
jgi:hypothetical protein